MVYNGDIGGFMHRALFVTATGTDIGKTYVTALILKQLKQRGFSAAYYKAALSGAQPPSSGIPDDDAYVARIAGLGDGEAVVSYRYRTAVSPHLAAIREGNPPDEARIRDDFQRLYRRFDFTAVEGSGGLICPLRRDRNGCLTLEDLVRGLGLTSVLTADAGLGTLNAVKLTADRMAEKGLPLAGVILNRYREGDFLHEDNREMIADWIGVPVLATVAEGADSLDETVPVGEWFREIGL